MNRVNHSIWWGKGLFNTNTIEPQLRRISNNFSGISFNVLNKLEDKDVEPKEYLDGWICMKIFLKLWNKKISCWWEICFMSLFKVLKLFIKYYFQTLLFLKLYNI